MAEEERELLTLYLPTQGSSSYVINRLNAPYYIAQATTLKEHLVDVRDELLQVIDDIELSYPRDETFNQFYSYCVDMGYLTRTSFIPMDEFLCRIAEIKEFCEPIPGQSTLFCFQDPHLDLRTIKTAPEVPLLKCTTKIMESLKHTNPEYYKIVREHERAKPSVLRGN